MKMYASLLPVVAFLATANAAALPRGAAAGEIVETKVVNGVTLAKRDNCWFDPFGVVFTCSGATTSSSSARASSTSSSASASRSSSAASSSSSSSSASRVSSSSSSAAAAPTTTSAAVAPSSSSSSSVSRSASSSSSSAAVTTSSSSSPVATVVSSSSSSAARSSSTSVSAVSSSSSSAAAAGTSSSTSSVVAVTSSSSAAAVAATTSAVSSAVTSSSSFIAASFSSSSVVVVAAAPSSSSSSVVSSIIASVSASSSTAPTITSSAVVVPTTTSTSTSSTSSAVPTPTNAAVSGWRYAGDIQEGTNGRALVAASTAGQGMTVDTCLAYCDSQNFPLAGLEYGAECYCGTVLSNGASLSKTATATMPCAGNAQQLCGGPATLSLYASTKSNGAGLSADLTSQAVTLPAGWSAASSPCIQEVAGRALVEKSTAADDMTIAKCAAFCGNEFKYAGLEYGRECYCGNTLQNGASLSLTSGQCVKPCAGDATNTCGGPNAIQLYTNANFKPVTSSGNFVNAGCVQEVAGRALRGASIAGQDMTIDKCTAFCGAQGFKIAGLEYGAECYCDNEWQGGASASLWSGQCNMPCAGAAGQNCGGPNAINVFTVSA